MTRAAREVTVKARIKSKFLYLTNETTLGHQSGFKLNHYFFATDNLNCISNFMVTAGARRLILCNFVKKKYKRIRLGRRGSHSLCSSLSQESISDVC